MSDDPIRFPMERVNHGIPPKMLPVEGAPGVEQLVEALARIIARTCAVPAEDMPANVLELPNRRRRKHAS